MYHTFSRRSCLDSAIIITRRSIYRRIVVRVIHRNSLKVVDRHDTSVVIVRWSSGDLIENLLAAAEPHQSLYCGRRIAAGGCHETVLVTRWGVLARLWDRLVWSWSRGRFGTAAAPAPSFRQLTKRTEVFGNGISK